MIFIFKLRFPAIVSSVSLSLQFRDKQLLTMHGQQALNDLQDAAEIVGNSIWNYKEVAEVQ